VKFDRAAIRRVDDAAADGVQAAAQHLEQASNALVPDLTGTLQASSRVSVDRSAAQAAVSYDDPAAVPQHERLDFRHDDGQAKYLEQPLHSEQRELLEAMAREMRRGLH
jgi:predicted RNA-binding protein with PUA-like domain